MRYEAIIQISDTLKVFRDDLYPFLGGGNKGRKMDAIAKDIFIKKANALVTTGGIQSNHCRAVAVFAAQHKMKCKLVLHGSKFDFENQSGNAKIMRLSGADIVFAEEASQIGHLMDISMLEFKNVGFEPYYIYGGGHNMHGGLAYIDAIKELHEYCEEYNWYPDYIFHATGTGSTQSGILAGLDKYNLTKSEVVGISVGRKSEYAVNVVDDFYKELCTYFEIACTSRKSIVIDDYLFGGYAKYSIDLENFCTDSLKNFGFTLDRCYTGKAYYGMLDYIKKNKIEQKNILFWHTGGILNFLAE